MAEDTTGIFKKDPTRSESKIFNTSVRGWIALILGVSVAFCLVLVVISSFFGVTMPSEITGAIIALSSTSMTLAVQHYFPQNLKEGIK